METKGNKEFKEEINSKIEEIKEYNEQKFLSLAKYTSGYVRYAKGYWIQIVKTESARAVFHLVEVGKAYYILKEMETEESFSEICENEFGVSSRYGYYMASIGETFGIFAKDQIDELGPMGITKMRIMTSAPAEAHRLITDGNFYGKTNDEIIQMSTQEFQEFTAQQKRLGRMIDTLKNESHTKDIKLREKEIENRELHDQIAALKNDDPRLQVPEDVLTVIDKIDAAEFSLTNLYNFLNENIHNLPEGKVFEDMVNARYTRFVAMTDRVIEVMKKIAFRGGIPSYDISDLIDPANIEQSRDNQPN